LGRSSVRDACDSPSTPEVATAQHEPGQCKQRERPLVTAWRLRNEGPDPRRVLYVREAVPRAEVRRLVDLIARTVVLKVPMMPSASPPEKSKLQLTMRPAPSVVTIGGG
jgi:hypothetical protein